MATATEQYNSPTIGRGQNPKHVYTYDVEDATGFFDAIAAAITDSGIVRDGLHLQGTSQRPLTADDWEVELEYGISRIPSEDNPPEFSFTTKGGRERVYQAVDVTEKHTLEPDPIDNGGAIGMTKDGDVEGVEIELPAMAESYTTYLPVNQLTGNYKRLLHRATGRTNSKPFAGYQAGEVKFLGVSGEGRGDDLVRLTFDFEMSPNFLFDPANPVDSPGLTVGPFANISKRGHQRLELFYRESVDRVANATVSTLREVHVQTIRESIDFDLFGLNV